MEKLIVLKKYNLAMATAKAILDLFCRQAQKELVFTIDVFNDVSLEVSLRDIESVHKILFDLSIEIILLQLRSFCRLTMNSTSHFWVTIPK